MNPDRETALRADDLRGSALEWMALTKASATNGSALLKDAELLLRNDRHPRAVSLAVLALEEFGKAGRALAVIASGGSSATISDFDRDFSRHGPKVAAGLTLHAMFEREESVVLDLLDRLPDLVDDSTKLKMRGFYVDRVGHGLSQPDDLDHAQAAAAVALAQVVNEEMVARVEVVTEEEAEALWSLGPQIMAVMREQLQGSDASGSQIMRAMREILAQIEAGVFGTTMGTLPSTSESPREE
ncbi:hypothetical protein GCM10009845_16110 [Pedococcus bigeumensis]